MELKRFIPNILNFIFGTIMYSCSLLVLITAKVYVMFTKLHNKSNISNKFSISDILLGTFMDHIDLLDTQLCK